MDERFSSVTRDHRFRPVRQGQRKVQIDKRFRGIFFNKNFQENFTVDKRGRPLQESNANNLRKYYHLSRKERKRIIIERRKDKERKAKLLNDEEPDSGDKCVTSSVTCADKLQSDSKFTDSDENSDSDITDSDEDEIDLARGKGNVESSSEDEDFEFDESDNDAPDHKWGELDSNVKRSEDTSHRLALCGMDWDQISASDIFVLVQSFKPPDGTVKSVTVYPSEYGIARMAEEDRCGPAELQDMKADKHDRAWSNEEDFNTEKLREYQLNRLKYYYAVIVCDSVSTAENIYNECDGLEFETSSAKLDLRFIPDGMEFNDHPPKQRVTSLPDPLTFKATSFVSPALSMTKLGLTWDETDPKRTAITRHRFTEKELENLDVSEFLASPSESEDDDDIDADRVDVNSKMDYKERAELYRKLLLEDCDNKSEDGDVYMEVTWEPGLKSTVEDDLNPESNKKPDKSPSDSNQQTSKDSQQASRAELEMIMIEDDQADGENDFELNVDDDRFSAMYTSSNYAIDQSNSSFKKSRGMKKMLTERQVRLKQNEESGDRLVLVAKESKVKGNDVASLIKSVKQRSVRLTKKSKSAK